MGDSERDPANILANEIINAYKKIHKVDDSKEVSLKEIKFR